MAAREDRAPGISYPSKTSIGPFNILAGNVIVHESPPMSGVYTGRGALMWSLMGRSTKSYHGGTLCVKSPARIEPLVYSLHKSSEDMTCNAVLVTDFNPVIQDGQHMIEPGMSVKCQWTYIDPWDPAGFGDGLTNAVQFVVCP